MKKLKILFDLDDTLVIGDMVALCSRLLVDSNKLDRIYTSREWTDWYLTCFPPILKETLIAEFHNPRFAVWEKLPMPGCYYLLRALEAMGHELGIVTSRSLVLRASTSDYLSKHFPGIRFIIGLHNCTKKWDPESKEDIPTKTEKLRELEPDMFIDDHIPYCNEAAGLGIDIYLASNAHTPWNHNKTKLNKRVKTIKNPSFIPHSYFTGE